MIEHIVTLFETCVVSVEALNIVMRLNMRNIFESHEHGFSMTLPTPNTRTFKDSKAKNL